MDLRPPTDSLPLLRMDTQDLDIVVSRTVDAPRRLVWKAFTDPKHVVRWWGPDGFTNTLKEMEVRPGGAWRFTMHGPDGTDYPNRIRYEEVTEPERLVYLHDDDEGGAPDQSFRVVTTFEDAGDGKTTVTLRITCRSAEQKAKLAGYGAVEGGKQTLARLAEYLKTM